MIARHLFSDRSGAGAAEFALILPLLLVFLLGTIDVARFLWECNRAEKATQMGARYAVVADLVDSGLASYSFATSGGLLQGQAVPQASFPGVSCVSTAVTGSAATAVSCTCAGTCGWTVTADVAAFNRIVARMRYFFPRLTAANVEIRYEYSGLGYAGDPNGADVAPLVVVRLRTDQTANRVTFKPLLYTLFSTSSIALPAFSASLTLEDGAGNVAN
ncbi:pilus assembly protein [Sphingomonas sp. MG17]|uniref:Pilus assembly protein n=1 Tax=Sphingomonas tagetis TaxID=2949092 RepID=A0A9X2HH74_9SPHN|nr:TadE/TadG family type IV pilus assembly protein [Sphingomonas tagetis]MCP3729532.1 pilus assembly protein [Sphingomonas tagetis]